MSASEYSMNDGLRIGSAWLVVAAFIALSSLGCALLAPKDAEHVALRIFEAHVFDGFTLSLIDIENDSRCPAQMMCIVAGNAEIAVNTAVPGPGATAVQVKRFLNTSSSPRTLQVAGATVRLDSLAPRRITADTIAQSSYTAYFTVTRP